MCTYRLPAISGEARTAQRTVQAGNSVLNALRQSVVAMCSDLQQPRESAQVLNALRQSMVGSQAPHLGPQQPRGTAQRPEAVWHNYSLTGSFSVISQVSQSPLVLRPRKRLSAHITEGNSRSMGYYFPEPPVRHSGLIASVQ